MTFQDLQQFFKGNWPVVLGVLVVVTPVVWAVLHFLFKNRMDELKAANNQLRLTIQSPSTAQPPGTRADNQPETEDLRCGSTPDCPLVSAYPRTNGLSQTDLIDRLRHATKRITVFGLTRNFFVSPDVQPVIVQKAQTIPVTFFLMDPSCPSRTDRYRIEPIEAALEDPQRFAREVELALREMLRRCTVSTAASSVPGLSVYYYNFPCSFAIEEIDDYCRVMLYGHGKRGTEGPIFVFKSGNPFYGYFVSQLRWLERLAGATPLPPWTAKGIVLRRLALDSQLP